MIFFHIDHDDDDQDDQNTNVLKFKQTNKQNMKQQNNHWIFFSFDSQH